jgi:hypothetical protein
MVVAAAFDDGLRDALLLQFGLITTQLKFASGSGNGVNTISALNTHVGPTARAVAKLSKLMEAAVGMDSKEAIGGLGSSGSSSSRVEENSEDADGQTSNRVEQMAPWLALAGCCLYFGGSQLLVLMESAAATAAPNLTGAALDVMQQVLLGLFSCALVTGAQIHQLQVLQPEKTVVRGLLDDAHPVLEALLDKMEAATKHLQYAVQCWKAASAMAARSVGNDPSRGSSLVWGKKL